MVFSPNTQSANTHSNADHDGGNTLLQNRLGCAVYATPMEKAVVEHPILEPSFLYGGYPFKKLRKKFLMDKPDIAIIHAVDADFRRRVNVICIFCHLHKLLDPLPTALMRG